MSHLSMLPLRARKPGCFQDINPLIPKLSRVVDLSLMDHVQLQSMCHDVRGVDARRDIMGDGEVPGSVHLILKGWACRYKILKNGKRQITALLLPGDLCDLHVDVLDRMDHAIGAITTVTFACVTRSQIDELFGSRPAIQRALLWTTLVDEGVLRAWLVSLGARTAIERVAHLICELRQRLRNVDLEYGDRFAMPLTQADLGEALGLTQVHINRVVRHLAVQGIVDIRHGIVTIHDLPALVRLADFDPTYLHAQSVEHR